MSSMIVLSPAREVMTETLAVEIASPSGTKRVARDLLSPAVSQRMTFFLAHLNRADLAVLRELLEAGKVRPVIDRTYPLGERAEAIGYLEQGHAVGKVAITV